MLRKVTLKPFTSAPNVSPTSRIIDAITRTLANDFGTSKSGLGAASPRRSRRQCLNDLLPVEAPVFDENLASMPPADDHARQMDPWHIALERIRIQRRLATFRIESHTQAFHEREIGMVAGQREHVSRGQSLLTGSIFDKHFVLRDLLHVRLEQRSNLAGLDPVLNVRPHPILDRCTKFLLAVHQRHAHAISIQVERGFRGGIFPANHNHILIPIFERLRVVVRNVRKILARHAQLVRQIVVPRGHGNLFAPVSLLRSLLRFRYYREVAVLSIDPHYPLVQLQFQRVVLRRLPGVFGNCKLLQRYCFGGGSRISASSRRNDSSSFNFSGVASTCFFFQTNTWAEPHFSFTLRFPSTRYAGGASSLIPPPGTAAKTAAQSPFFMHRALS